MDPRSQRLGGLLTTTDGLEQKADINPGRQTPGQRFGTEAVVVEGAEVVVAFGLAVVGRAVVDVTTDGLELPADGRDPEAGAVTLFVFCSLAPPPPSRRLMQHLPPLAQTALASIKSQRYEKNPVTQVPLHLLSSSAAGTAVVVVLGLGRVVVVVVRTVVVVRDVVVEASVVDAPVELASFKMTNSGGGSDSPKRDLVTQHFMAVLQSPSTLRTASQ